MWRKAMKETYVPSDIVREIFLCLPCKSLGRFRAISKEYRSHINDHKFMEEHRKRNVKPSHLLMRDSTNKTNLHLFNMSMNSYAYIKTISTHNYKAMPTSLYGMVCMKDQDNGKIALLNPLSGEITALPDLTEPFVRTRDCYFGFGFLPNSKRYKIICLEAQDTVELKRVHTLTVAQNNNSSWKTVDVPKLALDNESCWKAVNRPERPLVFYFCQDPACVDGVLYWEMWISGPCINVLVIDLETEEMKVIPSPAKLGYCIYTGVPHLVVLEGALCCFEIRAPTNNIMPMDIWKLRHDDINNNVDWALCYKLDICLCYPEMTTLIPLYIYDGKRILLHNQLLGFYWYDIEDKQLTIYPSVGEVEVAAAIGLGFYSIVTPTLHSETLCHPLY